MLTIRSVQIDQMAHASPGRQMVQPCEGARTWVEVLLVDENDAPVPKQRYRVQLPDGSLMTGNLNDEGKVRFDSIVAGTCQISFPDIHSKEWQPV
jgi:hypothetical protein